MQDDILELPATGEVPRPNHYPSDVSDLEWAFVAPYLTLLPKEAKQRRYPLRDVYNALRYILRTGASWRYLPHDFPPWQVVYHQARRWERQGVFEQLSAEMNEMFRSLKGRGKHPSLAIIDSRSIKATPESGTRAGYDAGKKVKDSKIHLVVDTEGLPIACDVTPANVPDRDAAERLARRVNERTGESVILMMADGAYQGEATKNAVATAGIELVIVKRSPEQQGFVVLPKRWIVERTFGWMSRFKRLARDHERLPQMLAFMHVAVAAMLVMPRLIRQGYYLQGISV